MQPFICFIHIGKNGGTTFNQILHDSLSGFFSIPYHEKTEGKFNKDHLRKFLRMTTAKGVGGHTIKPSLDYESIVKRPVFYITFLREPVKRYVSAINHRMYHGRLPNIELTFRFPRYQDFQTRHLTGERQLEKAVDTIQRLDFVGILEQYDLSLLLLRQQLKPYFDLNINYQKVNVAKDHNAEFYNVETLSEDQLNQIKNRSAIDIQLYQKGLEQFEQMKADYKGDLQADLAAFQESNKHYRRKKTNYYIQKAKNGLVRKIIQPIIVS